MSDEENVLQTGVTLVEADTLEEQVIREREKSAVQDRLEKLDALVSKVRYKLKSTKAVAELKRLEARLNGLLKEKRSLGQTLKELEEQSSETNGHSNSNTSSNSNGNKNAADDSVMLNNSDQRVKTGLVTPFEAANDQRTKKQTKRTRDDLNAIDGVKLDSQALIKQYEARDVDSAEVADVAFEGGLYVPGEIWANLLDYQKTCVQWLWELHCHRVGGIVGDEMGLGKTVQIAAFLASLEYSNLFGPTLVVCPTTVMRQWMRELQKWWPKFNVHLFPQDTTARDKVLKKVMKEGHILVLSYESLRIHQDKIVDLEWEYIVLDEGHRIRNPDADTTIACKRVKTPHRLILTGTPIQNRLTELWSLFDFVFPGKLGTLPTFTAEFAYPIQQGGYANANALQVQTAFKCAVILRDLVQSYLLRRMKKDVNAQLPKKSEQVLFCRLTDAQIEMYRKCIVPSELEAIMEGRVLPFRLIIILRKICNHLFLYEDMQERGLGMKAAQLEFSRKLPKAPRRKKRRVLSEEYDEEDEYAYQDSDTGEIIEVNNDDDDDEELAGLSLVGNNELTVAYQLSQCVKGTPKYEHLIESSGKLKVLVQVLHGWFKGGHKVLLFSQTRQMLDILHHVVRQEGYNNVRLDGTVSVADRDANVDAFNKNDDIFIFLLTTRAGGLGLNLTSADRVVIFDPDWNPATDAQARERAWRLGQKRPVVIYRFMTAGTIEEKIYHRQIFKQHMTDRVLKDPKTRGAFKHADLHELFVLDEKIYPSFSASSSSSSSSRSSSKPKAPIAHTKSMDDDDAPEKNEDHMEQVDGVVGAEQYTNPQEAEEQEQNNNGNADGEEKGGSAEPSDTDILKNLMDGAVIEAAVSMKDTNVDRALVSREAERVAKSAARALLKSRQECAKTGGIGVPTWTGRNGFAGATSSGASSTGASPQPRFGTKNTALATAESATSLVANTLRFGGTSGSLGSNPLKLAQSTTSAVAGTLGASSSSSSSSSSNATSATQTQAPSIASLILQRAQQREKEAKLYQESNTASLHVYRADGSVSESQIRRPAANSRYSAAVDVEQIAEDPQRGGMIKDIVQFLKSQPGKNATSSEILASFKSRIKKGDAELFRLMLREVATLEDKRWYLKIDYH